MKYFSTGRSKHLGRASKPIDIDGVLAEILLKKGDIVKTVEEIPAIDPNAPKVLTRVEKLVAERKAKLAGSIITPAPAKKVAPKKVTAPKPPKKAKK